MTTDEAWFIPTNGACLIHDGYITMLWPLSWDDDNWWSMIHTRGIYNHALSVVMRRWQLTEHVLYMNDILQCSDRCYETMTTDGACFILEGCITMLWPLSWDDNNWRSMVHTLGIYYQALTVVFIRWQLTEQGSYPWVKLPYSDRCHETIQLTEHDSYLRVILPCSDRCHLTMTTDGAWFKPEGYKTMLCPLSWDDDNWQSMFIHVWYITMLWQLSWHYENWQAWLIPEGYITMLCPLSWDDDNWQSMFYTWMIYHHALTVVLRRWQLIEHVSFLRDISPCSDHCHETTTTDGAWFIP